MPKNNDVLLYENIDMFSSSEFINAISLLESEGADELTVRINTNGGEPAYMWGMVAKFKEFTGKKLVKVDGKAFSCGLFFLCYSDDSQALDIAQGVVHRAAYPDWFEADPEYFTEEIKNALIQLNKNLEAAFRAKVNVEAFEALPQMKSIGATVADIFSMDSRINIYLSAKDMKKIKLVNRIVAITPEVQAELSYNNAKVLAKYSEPIEKPLTKNKMTKEEFKAAHPSVYAEIVAAANAEGVAQERDRVEGIMVFAKIAPEICNEAIASGKNFTEKQRNEIYMKQMSANALGAIADEAAKETPTGEAKVIPANAGTLTPAQIKEANAKAVEAEVLATLGVPLVK